MLRDLHDELDRLVADAYGRPWPMETEEILARLVALPDDLPDWPSDPVEQLTALRAVVAVVEEDRRAR